MRRALAILALAVALVALLAGSAGAATAVTAKSQLRGHLPELGERPTMRVFVTQDAYDTYRNSLGEANVFPPAGSLFMTFDKEILALYTRGNDTGGRCIGTQISASFSGDTLAATATWQAGTSGAQSAAPSPTRSPAAAASPPAAAADNGTNILLYAMLIAIVFLVLLSLFLSRGGRRRYR